jgi:hypothetical protein
MQCVNRCVEIAVFLLQPCELGLEFALIFVGHGLLNQNADEICENPRQAVAQLSSQARRSASAFHRDQQAALRSRAAVRLVVSTPAESSGSNRCADAFASIGNAYPAVAKGLRVPTHNSLQMPVKYEDCAFQTHRQIRALV